MVTKAYIDYIKSERWKRKRQAVFRHYGKRCYACRKYAKVLHVHHLTYARLGKESIKDLIPLCVPCHKEVTRLYRRNRRRGLRHVTMEFVKMRRGQVDKRR
jgi:5-methylcytosine-specific restriction endonuclease McrA